MTITQIETNITKLIKNFSRDSFVFDFLLAYGEPKATITRLKKGDLNQLESKGELTQRKKLFFKEATANLHGTIEGLRTDSATQKQKPRFIIVTDYETLLGFDTKTTDTLDEREQHSEKTLAQLYDPDKMPQGLKEAHHQLDSAIERCYRKKPFENDEERFEYLFKLYEEMVNNANN
jgi:hypothetical protein